MKVVSSNWFFGYPLLQNYKTKGLKSIFSKCNRSLETNLFTDFSINGRELLPSTFWYVNKMAVCKTETLKSILFVVREVRVKRKLVKMELLYNMETRPSNIDRNLFIFWIKGSRHSMHICIWQYYKTTIICWWTTFKVVIQYFLLLCPTTQLLIMLGIDSLLRSIANFELNW